jgi:hypothetical protein
VGKLTKPDETVKPLLKVGDEFTVNNLFEFEPIIISLLIVVAPLVTDKPPVNVCVLDYVLALSKLIVELLVLLIKLLFVIVNLSVC